ncbi:MAG TPA: ATP-binding protein [Defluviitoga sp.]|nr:ATP-binding protein [Defluviitoga sp.]HPZ29345.1 ATP-binding protein [Defluviitoga sp.]
MSILLLVFGLSSYYALSYNLYENTDNLLVSRMNEVQISLHSSKSIEQINQLKSMPNEMIFIYNYEGKLVRFYGFYVEIPNFPQIKERVSKGESFFLSTTTDYNWNARFYVSAINIDENPLIIVVGRFIDEINTVLSRLKKILIFIGIFVIVLAGIGGFILANKSFKPVSKIIDTAQRIEENNLNERIEVQSEDELGRLASTLNQMISRLERAFEQQKQFTADVSHDLRTPLSIIQAETSLTLKRDRTTEEYKNSLQLIQDEVLYMSSIIDKLLFLARSDSKSQYYNFTTIDLKDLLEELIQKLKPLFHAKKLELHYELQEDLTVRGDKEKLKEAFLNILDNALKYTKIGKVTILLQKSDDKAVVSILDTGPGIPEKDLSFIFDRFYRVDKARSNSEQSTGLGLAIVKEIIEVHNGQIEVTSKEGEGTTFYIILPLISD